MKQSTKQQNTTTTTVKNPNWPEANQSAIYKCSWEVEPGTTRNKFSEWSERVLNPGSPDLKASALTTGPHCLQDDSGEEDEEDKGRAENKVVEAEKRRALCGFQRCVETGWSGGASR